MKNKKNLGFTKTVNKGTKALFLKELKEHIYGFVCFLAILAGTKFFIQFAAQDALSKGHYPNLNVNIACYFVVPFYTLYLGVSTFAYEKDKGTIVYLSSLPVSKSTLWMVKALAAFVYCVGAIVVLPFVINNSSGITFSTST